MTLAYRHPGTLGSTTSPWPPLAHLTTLQIEQCHMRTLQIEKQCHITILQTGELSRAIQQTGELCQGQSCKQENCVKDIPANRRTVSRAIQQTGELCQGHSSKQENCVRDREDRLTNGQHGLVLTVDTRAVKTERTDSPMGNMGWFSQ